MNLSLQCFSKN